MQFGSYIVDRAVEQHGSVTIYAAKDASTGQKVLLSVFKPPAIIAAQQWTERLITLRRLQHPNIATASEGSITPEGEQYAVTPFMSPLLGRNRVLSPQDLLEVTHQISEALDFAHRQGINHGAMRPAHISQVSPRQFVLRGWELAGAGEPETDDIASLGQFIHRALTGQFIVDNKLSAQLPPSIANVLRDTLPSGSGFSSAGALHGALAAAIKAHPARQRKQVLINLPQEKLRTVHNARLLTALAFIFIAIFIAAIAAILFLSQAAMAQVPVATVAQIPTDTPTINRTAVYDSSDAT